MHFGVLICADVWEALPARRARQAGAEVLLVLNASPFHIDKQPSRYEVAKLRVKETGLPVVYANMVGGGRMSWYLMAPSFVLDNEGAIAQQLSSFEEALALVELEKCQSGLRRKYAPVLAWKRPSIKRFAWVLHDYIRKNGFPGVVLGPIWRH